MKTFPILSTERLVLRQLSEMDAEEVFLLRSDELINKYLDRKPCKTLEDALSFIRQIKNNSLSYWAITRKGSEKLVGTICLFDVSEEHKSGEIGYELLTEFQGRGIMREAATEVIAYARRTLGLITIDAYTHKDNQGSGYLLRQLHFTIIGRDNQEKSHLTGYRLTI